MATTGYSQSSLRLTVITVSDTAPALGDEILVFANLQNTDTSNAFSGIVRFEVANGIHNLSDPQGLRDDREYMLLLSLGHTLRDAERTR